LRRRHRAKSIQKSPEAVTQLTPRQHKVTQERGTEPVFDNVFWDKKDAGIYVDIVSGDPDYIPLEFIAPG
jgi:peptide methionine sulfoxide reductase MsrB